MDIDTSTSSQLPENPNIPPSEPAQKSPTLSDALAATFGLNLTEQDLSRLNARGHLNTIRAARHQIMTLLFEAGIPMNQEKRIKLTAVLEATI